MSSSEPNAVARWTDHAIDCLAGRKAEMLAGAIALSVLLAAAALADIAVGNGEQLTKSVVDAGGYLACLAILLGLPALGYAMVADRSIAALSASEREKMHATIAKLLDELARRMEMDAYHIQVFRPDWREGRLRPFYESQKIGPAEGWRVSGPAPQAITGSAWVAGEWTFAQGEQLRGGNDLHLTAAQRARYNDLTGVAAAPVFDAAGERLAVLTICTKKAEPEMEGPRFRALHLAMAQKLSEVLRGIVGPLDLPSIDPAITTARGNAGRMPITHSVVGALPSVEDAATSFLDLSAPEHALGGALSRRTGAPA
jgi:hypothetical protein